MADPNNPDLPEGTPPSPKKGRFSALNPFSIVAALNSLALLAGIGFVYYTTFIFKHTEITETSERKRLTEHTHAAEAATPGLMKFESMTVNIQTTPEKPLPADGTRRQLQGKLHYITLEFALEIKDISKLEDAEIIRPLILDKLVQSLGRKNFHELATVQGRYVLNTEIVDFSNRLVAKYRGSSLKEPWVTNVLFTQFIVQ